MTYVILLMILSPFLLFALAALSVGISMTVQKPICSPIEEPLMNSTSIRQISTQMTSTFCDLHYQNPNYFKNKETAFGYGFSFIRPDVSIKDIYYGTNIIKDNQGQQVFHSNEFTDIRFVEEDPPLNISHFDGI